MSLALGAAVMTGCYYSPTETARLEESVILTARDQDMNFGVFRSFFVRPDVRGLDQAASDTAVPAGCDVLPGTVPSPLLAETESKLLERGYTEADQASADLGLELVYVKSVEDDFYCT